MPPPFNLQEEQEAARKVGLPLTHEDGSSPPSQPRDDDTAVWSAVNVWEHRAESYEPGLPVFARNTHVVQGKASAAEREEARAWLTKAEGDLVRWRKASRVQRLDWTKGRLFEGPDGTAFRYGTQSLIAAAALGIQPKENLLAAARLTSLLGAGTGPALAQRRVKLGGECLAVAKQRDLSKEIARALGPAPDFHLVLRPLPPELFGAIRANDNELRQFHREDLLDDAEARAVHGWAQIWRSLPADGKDYLGAVRVLEAQLPAVEILGSRKIFVACAACRMHYGPSRVADTLRKVAQFEAERAELLK